MEVKPLHNRIVIKRHDPNLITKGGIIIPDVALGTESTLWQGTVIKVGRGVFKSAAPGALGVMGAYYDKPEIEVGDEVLYDKHAGVKVILSDGSEIVVLRDTDVYLIITEGE